MENDRVSLMVRNHRLFSAPDKRRWSPQFPGCQRQQLLHRKIFAATKCSANSSIANDNALFRYLEDAGDLAAIFVQPLSRRFNDEPLLLINKGDAGFWLQESVFLPGGGKGLFKHHISPGQRLICVPFAD